MAASHCHWGFRQFSDWDTHKVVILPIPVVVVLVWPEYDISITLRVLLWSFSVISQICQKRRARLFLQILLRVASEDSGTGNKRRDNSRLMMKNSLDLDLLVHVLECCPLKSNADKRYITLQIVLLCIELSSQLLTNGYRSLDLANPLLFLVLELVFQLCTGLFVSGVWKPCRGSCLWSLWKLLPHSCREPWDHRWEGRVGRKVSMDSEG